MRADHIDILRCPDTGSTLELVDAEILEGRVRTGHLVNETGTRRYPIVDHIPRFVAASNYADNFGVEWNIHDRTQHDQESKQDVSRLRFFEETGWPRCLEGERILEVGCGSGRFTTHAASTGATVVSLDYSSAVEANYRSNGWRDNVLIVQASAYAMPLAQDSVDRAFCFGVIQHTPDPKMTFMSIPPLLRSGGHLATDVYVKNLTHWVLQTKYYVRPFVKKIDPRRLYGLVTRYIDFVWPLARLIRKIPRIGYAINWRLLIADYSHALHGATDDTLREWAYLDTFDMLSPKYDIPQTLSTFKRWHAEAGLRDCEVHYGYNGIEGRGRKP